MDASRRVVELRPDSRVSLYAVLALCLLSCVGQGIAYFNPDSYDPFNVGVFFVIIASGVAGMVSSLAGYPLEKPGLSRGLTFCALGFGLEIVVGEVIAVVALTTGASDDGSLLLGALALGGFGGGGCLLLGWAAGLLVLWPIISLLGLLRQRVAGKPINEAIGVISVMSLTVIAFAITGVLGVGSASDDVVGTPQGRGLAQIVLLLIRYSGSPTEQLLSWVARALLVGLVLEVFWLGHLHRLRKARSALSSPAPAEGPSA